MVPTAKEQLIENWGFTEEQWHTLKSDLKKSNLIDLDDIITEMKLCAKLHCTEQAIVISENVEVILDSSDTFQSIDEKSILNAYPLDNIK